MSDFRNRRRALLSIVESGLSVALVAAPWVLLADRLMVSLIPAGVVTATWSASRRLQMNRVVVRGVVAIVALGISFFALALGVLPDEVGGGFRVRAALVVLTVILAALLHSSSARHLATTNLVVFAVALLISELAVRATSPQEREEARWARLAQQHPDAPSAPVAPRVTMDEEKRTTTGNPLSPSRRLVLFGGSTTFARAVDDRDTWASVLQDELNRSDLNIRVDNFGVQGAAIEHMAPWVRREVGTSIRSGDLVVVYAGVNEAKNAVLFGRNALDRLRSRFSRFDAFVGALLRRSDLGFLIERTLNSGEYQLEESSFANTEASLREIRAAVEGVHAHLVVVLQPQVFVRRDKTSYEETMIKSLGTFPTAIQGVYPRIADILLSQPGAIDGRAIFDTFDGSPYLDWCHVGVEGNRAIGEWMYDRLLPILRDGA